MEKKQMVLDGRVTPVREVLSRFTTKLSEAQDLLQRAVSTVQETDDANKANMSKYQSNEVTTFYLLRSRWCRAVITASPT